MPTNDDPTVGEDEGFVTPLGVPLVLRAADLLANDFDIEQADHDGDGTIDDDLDDPRRPRPTFDGVEGVYDAEALALGQRIPRGEAEVVAWAGETFVVVRFAEGFSGAVAVEYRIRDADGATDTGLAKARVGAAYDGTLRGSSLPDLVAGSAGADAIRAFAGSDLVRAGAGDDRIEAGDGDDRIEAGAGDDWIDGGRGSDRIDGGDGVDTVSFENSDIGIRADLESRIGQGGTAQGDTYLGIEALTGSRFADQLGGDAGANRLEGLEGDDLIEGRGGDDSLVGGAGDDVLAGGAGADTLEGGAGRDTADYAFGTVGIAVSLTTGSARGGDAEGDVLAGIENLAGTDAADTLEGDAGGNVLSGGRGDDLLLGGAGDDTLIGGRGADRLAGGEGIDVADYTLSAEGVAVDMADGAAGGGDAAGDVFSGIEIVQGSYHDDTIRGDAGDNRLRGGRGADLLDGRGGFDTADYGRADEGVSVDLATGRGTGGEAAGDRLVAIEGLLGSLHADRLAGSAADERFQGSRGDDTLAGAAGSDTYLFGFDDGQDLVVEEGKAADTDRLVLAAGIAPRDVSVVREGDDLLLEFERQDGFLVDTVRARGHFLGRETGLEEVVFADGTVWTRERLDTLQRLGRFNAADDVVRFAREDELIVIDPALLMRNDADGETGALTLVGVGDAVNGSVALTPDGRIAFLGAPNVNGDAFFTYTVRDAFGRESSARVEVDLAPVNDAPVAVDDPLVPAVEDRILRIRIETLLANDSDVDGEFEGLHIAAIGPLTNGAGVEIDRYKELDYAFAATNATARLSGDYLELRLRPDYFGPAGFVYTLSDASGATATARVEIAIAPVNDAPRDRDRSHEIRLGRDAVLTVADLLADAYDIEGDGITFVGLHAGLDGEPGRNGRAMIDAASGTITFTPLALGEASLAYDVVDARGAAATLTYDFRVRPLNDAPRAGNDYGLRTLEDQALVIDPATLLANDSDENGDTLVIAGVSRFAEGGKVRLRDDGRIEFRPTADYNGAAGFAYTVSDGRGGTATARVAITVLPRNEGPVLRNDRVGGIEDGPSVVIPAEAFGNDVEPDGDVLFFKRAVVLGRVDHRFLSAGFTADAALADGSALPSWLRFDPATLRFSGEPAGTAPVAVDVWVTDPANGRVFNTRLSLTETMIRQGFDARALVLDGYEIRRPFAVSYAFGADDLDAQTRVTASLADGAALPGWLRFDAAALRFTGTPPAGTAGPIVAHLTFTRPGPAGGEPIVFRDEVVLDPAALPAGIAYDSRIALFDTRAGTVSAVVAGGRPLPDWLSFDTVTRRIGPSGFPPEEGASGVRLQVVFAPGPRVLPDGVVAASDRGFTLEFVVDPARDLDGQVTAINRILAGDAYFAAQGLFALDLEDAGPITAARESGAPLPSWLAFDPATLGFSGSPPPAFVGAVPVRLDVAAGAGRPALSVITEALVDDTVKLVGLAAGVVAAPGELRLGLPQDFDGTIVLSYDAVDEKGGASQKPALVFYDVAPARERPDAVADAFAGREGESTRFAVTDLLRNDFDRDRDRLRVLALGQPANGRVRLELARAVLAAPDDLAPRPGASFTASLADGTPLPSWLAVDGSTGTISGEVPLAFLDSLAIRLTRTFDGLATSRTAVHRFDGYAGARAVYAPAPDYSGEDRFTYVVTDDREGASTGTAVVRVAALFDPPTAVADDVAAREDTPLVIDPRALLANDTDVDGDPIRFVGVANARHGSVAFDGARILFTPERDFDGEAAFEYVVTDDRHGSSTGRVRVAVASTNRAPVAQADGFAVQEDVPFTFTTAQLLANDGDPDGDALTFQSLSRKAEGGRIVELTDGRWQFVPEENVVGPVRFAYTIGDGRRLSTGVVTFTVAPVNDAPIANPDGAGTANDPRGVFRTTRDRTLTLDLAVLLANDRDVEGDGFAIVEVFDGDQGSVVRDGATAVFTPKAGYVGDAGFHYRVADVHGASSVGYATLLVAPDAPLPIPVSDTGFEMLEDRFIDIDPAALMANDVVPEGSVLTFVGLEGAERRADGTYRVTPRADFNGDLVLVYAVKNEQDFPVETTVTIRVLPVADAPVARPDALALREDTPLTLFASQLLANDADADGEAIVFTRIIGSAGVSVADLGFGQLRVDPDADFNGEGWFDYAIEDSTGLAAAARVAVTVSPVNDAPVIAALPVLKGIEDRRFSAALPAGFVTDVDGDALLLEVRGKGGGALPSWLSFDPRTRTLSGDPPVDFNGTVALEVSASDASASAKRELLVSIAPVADTPVLLRPLPDHVGLGGEVLALALDRKAFGDADGDALSLSARLADGSALPSWLAFDGATFTGTPPRAYGGDLDIVVQASDGALTATDVFRLTIVPGNAAPVLATALPDVRVPEDGPIRIEVAADHFTDPDGDALGLSARLADGSALPSWLVFDGTTFTGTPPADVSGALDIRVTASDGTLAADGTFRLTIVPVNDAPVLVSPLADVTVREDTAVSIPIPADRFADIEGDALTFGARLADGSDLPTWLSLRDGCLTGTPPANFTGTLAIEIVASDGALAASGVFRLTVAPVNDAPVVATALPDVVSPRGAAISIAVPAGSFGDVDGDALALTARLADGSALPSWLAFDGTTFSGRPPATFTGALDLRVTASDVFRLTVSATNRGPSLVRRLPDATSPEDSLVSVAIPAGSFRDPDGNRLTLTARLSSGAALPSWLAFDGATFAGTPPADYAGALDIRVTASDGALTTSDVFRLTITPVNDAPVLARPLPDATSPEDSAVSVTIPAGSFTDVDSTLTYAATLADGTALPSWLRFSGTRFTGAPPADYAGALDIRVTARDGTLSTSDVFRLTVTLVNDRPVAANDGPFAVIRGDTRTIAAADLLANDRDPDGDALAVVAVGEARNGLVALGPDGGIRYTPDFGYEGADRFSYTVGDGTLTAAATVQLAVSDAFAGWRRGTGGADTMTGSDGAANSLFGGAGSDRITGGDRADRLAGGGGNDTLTGNDGDDLFWGMSGNDTIVGGAGFDTAHYNGIRSSYRIATVDGTVRVVDLQPGTHGNDGTDTVSSVERLVFRNGETVSVAAPIVLDLDGAGIETRNAGQSAARFDIDGDGTPEATSWIGPTEAFLVLDRNGDGAVSGIDEISFVDEVAGARSDLEGLRALDGDGDGLLSASDARFGDLRLWQDRDGDGHQQDGEILTLAQAEVRAIDLSGAATDRDWAFGSTVIVHHGSYIRTDGRRMDLADAALTALSRPDPVRTDLAATTADALARLRDAAPAPFAGWPTTTAPAAAAGAIPEGDDAARLLALMRQDMSSFGTRSGEADQAWRRTDQIRPMDYFA
ncbi:Ca2+-binding protein, RTX toxin-related [Methylobacterium sp. ap11]|nr:Ca2+-binding protein, RTX toxin-related [Methylobacterium sp. ap11]